MLLHSVAFKTMNTIPKLVTLTIHFGKDYSGADIEIRQPYHTVTPGFSSSLVLCPHDLDHVFW